MSCCLGAVYFTLLSTFLHSFKWVRPTGKEEEEGNVTELGEDGRKSKSRYQVASPEKDHRRTMTMVIMLPCEYSTCFA